MSGHRQPSVSRPRAGDSSIKSDNRYSHVQLSANSARVPHRSVKSDSQKQIHDPSPSAKSRGPAPVSVSTSDVNFQHRLTCLQADTATVGLPIMHPSILSEIMEGRDHPSFATIDMGTESSATVTSETKASGTATNGSGVDDQWAIIPLRPAPRRRRKCVAYNDDEGRESDKTALP
jgi:hypothetical protein